MRRGESWVLLRMISLLRIAAAINVSSPGSLVENNPETRQS